jgi:teichuronic acid biosynthesis glycosyltransferase TuaH
MNKILYLMHVPWGWIKQRPHFIAENLADHYDVTVCYRKPYRKNRLTSENKSTKLFFAELRVLPFNKIKLIKTLNRMIFKWQLRFKVRNFGIVWVTDPALYYYIKDALSNKTRLVYDCMDDNLEFPDVKSNQVEKERLECLENSLVARADIILASSEHLKIILLDRYNTNKDIIVLNNGIDQNRLGNSHVPLSSEISNQLDNICLKKIMYIGTISSWIDFDLILNSLNELKDIIYILIGPCEIETPKHERLLIYPPVEHSQVFTLMSKADILVMPFIVNDLIKSVNPVKVYEYIYSGKPTIVVRYGETEQFAQYVNLYNGVDEYISALRECANNDVALAEAEHIRSQRFVLSNTWKERIDYIRKCTSF